ncbi:MAG TPA: hypothetical protein VH599_14835 [Ktedonobacterales bacterium]|jgi:hypothetical protein
MRAHASGIERLLVRSLPLALALGLLGAALSGLAPTSRGPVARADNPSIRIVSPASASGPVQTGIEIVGAGWTAGDMVQVFYNKFADNQPCGDPNNAQALADAHPLPGVSIQIPNPDTWKVDFQWPSDTGIGQFYICAFDKNTPTQVTPSNQPFNVLSTSLPSLSVDNSFPHVGEQITVNGQGFLPGNQTVDLLLAQPGQQTGTKLTTARVGNDGSFSQKITLPQSQSGQLDVVAVSRSSVGGAIPPLIASQAITVDPTPLTPTPGPTSTPTPDPTASTPTGSTTGTSPTTSSKSGLLLTALVLLLALVILAIFGVLIWYVLGTRPPAGAGSAVPPPSAPRSRGMGPPRRGQSGGWRSEPGRQSDDEWESLQGPWEEDEQGGWSDLPTQWSNEANPWPQDQRGQSGPADYGNSGAQRPAPPRGPTRDDWQGRARPGQDDW